MKRHVLLITCLLATACGQATETTKSDLNAVDTNLNAVDAKKIGASVGSVHIVETRYGLAFYPNLTGLTPGMHGFHVHESPLCTPSDRDGVSVAALAAGGHLDPQKTKRHGEPWGNGHLGDLPPLYVSADGRANSPVFAPRLKLTDVLNRSLMVHAGGDNFSDQPAPLGGGGARVACGVIGG